MEMSKELLNLRDTSAGILTSAMDEVAFSLPNVAGSYSEEQKKITMSLNVVKQCC